MTSESPQPLIFSTRILPPELQAQIKAAGLGYEAEDFIKVENHYDSESFRNALFNSDSSARVFTSKNSVRSLKQFLAQEPQRAIPEKKTFTVGIKATEMLLNLGIKSNVRADNALKLAQIIARNSDVKSIDFFCGNKALDDLPEYLESKNVRVHQEVVYQTDLVHHIIATERIKAAIFLSPTAAFSFFKKNKLAVGVPAFCIGATTAEAVRMRSENPRICADEPTLESVVNKVIAYFGESQKSNT